MARKRKVKDKFKEEKSNVLRPLVPMNRRQKEYIDMINKKPLVIATGFAGTSKTYIPTVMACDALLKGKLAGGTDKIIITRPNISNSQSLGFFKGSMEEKYSYWLAPVLNVMRDRLGTSSLKLHIEKGNIEFVPLEVVKGYSASDCFFIVDEAEDLTWDEVKKIITRQGEGCKLVLAGDITQSELKGSCGLKKLIELTKKYPHLDVGVIDFNDFGDIVRSKSTREWIKVMTKEKL